MQDGIAIVMALAAFIGVWLGMAHWLKGKSKGWFVRQLVSFPAGTTAALLVVAVLLEVGFIESSTEPGGGDKGRTTAVAKTAANEGGDIEGADRLATNEVSNVADAGDEEGSVEVSQETDQWAEQRAAIEAGPDLGITPAQYAERFNAYMRDLEQPYSIQADYEPSGMAQDSFTASINQNLALTGTAKTSGMMNGLMMIGQGDGTNESGARLMLGAAVGFASAQEGRGLEHMMGVVLDLVSEATEKGEKAAREFDGMRYTLMVDDMIGAMFSAEPVL